MGYSRRIFSAVCAVTCLTATNVNAGGTFDFPEVPVVSTPTAVPVATYSAWYLRGDIGWGINDEPDVSRSNAQFNSVDMKDSLVLGGGLGYFFTDQIRGDVTIDHRFEADIDARNATTGQVEEFDVSNTVFLANVYYDWQGREDFSPYVGAGLGFTLNEMGNDQNRTNLAAALMAGVSYRIRDDWSIDAGYRFLYLGEARTDSSATTPGAKIEDLMAHELRIGVRYEFE